MATSVRRFLTATSRPSSPPPTRSFRGTVGAICDQRDGLRFTWKLEDFFSLSRAVNDFYVSPVFVFLGRRFHLQLYPNGDSGFNSEGWFGIFLFLADEPCSPLEVGYILGIRNSGGDIVPMKSGIHTFREAHVGKGGFKCLKRSELSLWRHELVPSDVLTLTVSLSAKVPQLERVTTGIDEQGIGEAERGRESSGSRETDENTEFTILGQNLKDLYMAGKDCDVTFKVGDKMFHAHKLILGARMPVFSAMFSHNMLEAETGVVCVEDCHPEAFEVFLRFVYSGVAENLTGENVANVYYTADKYDLPGLKKECVRHMLSNLDADSVLSVIALAESHGEEVLLEGANDFFVKNATEIISRIERRSFNVKNNSLANDFHVRAYQNAM